MSRYRLVHRLPWRLRLISPILAQDEEKSYLFEILLRKHPAVRGVRLSPRIGSAAIDYDAQRLPEHRLLAVVDAILGNLASAAPRQSSRSSAPIRQDQPIQEYMAVIEGMTCASCAALIELSLKRDPQVIDASVNYAAETLHVRGRLGKEEVFAHVARLGYRAQPMDTLSQRKLARAREKARIEAAKKRFLSAAIASAPVLLSGMLMHRQPLLRLLEFILTSYVVLGPARPIFTKALALARQGEANMDTLIALGSSAAYLYSLPGLLRPHQHVYFESAAAILAFVLAGRYLEERAKGKASEAIHKLIALQPAQATRVTPQGDETVAIDAIVVGDLLRVRPGEKIPLDGVVIEGEGQVNESLVTGEARPVTKKAGDLVIGGTLNIAGSFLLRVCAVGAQTVLAGIVRLVDAAQGAKLPVQKLADRISARFVPTVGFISAATLMGWLLAGRPFALALAHAVAVLLIACPCALGLATPTAIMVGMGEAARRGIYLRKGEALEHAARLDVLVFDKTGTLTEGHPQVTDFLVAAGEDEQRLLALAAGVERHSEHYLARAIVEWAHARQVTPAAQILDFCAVPGAGVVARMEEAPLRLGSAKFLADAGIDVAPWAQAAEAFARQGKTPVYLAQGARCLGLFAIADAPRPQAQAMIERLHQMGIETILATGDVPAVAHHIAELVGIRHVYARLSPADKQRLVMRLKESGRRVGMIGDGVNDAPALAAADVGFAVGGGSDIAVEAADVSLIAGDIGRVATAIELARETMAIIRQNLFWALGYNVTAIPIAASGKLTPMIAAGAMALSSFSVVANSLRLQRRSWITPPI
ncbi:MAG: heavy metal translocating P-type ATPase [Rhodocyclaceae bacterium]|nr:heavy metal translocating P-type ATPase [Rhodocyclaceae bacterium]